MEKLFKMINIFYILELAMRSAEVMAWRVSSNVVKPRGFWDENAQPLNRLASATTIHRKTCHLVPPSHTQTTRMHCCTTYTYNHLTR